MTPFPQISLLVLAIVLAGCSPRHDPAPVAESPAALMTAEEAAAMAASIADSRSEAPVDASGYAGQWSGAEGTSLTVSPVSSGYQVVIRNLDGPRTYVGHLEADGIHFVREKLPLVLHKGDGRDTGMKDLADKHDCVVVMANEGYCRD